MAKIRRRLVIVGDAGCGKTCLVSVFATGVFPADNVLPTVFTPFVADVELNGKHIELSLKDTAAQEEFARLRHMIYPDSDVILICFAIDCYESLDKVQAKWIPEVMHFCPGIPVVLVGCKKDLRRDSEKMRETGKVPQGSVSYEEGIAVAQSIGARHYLECSAKTGESVSEVFQRAAIEALTVLRNKQTRLGSKCVIV